MIGLDGEKMSKCRGNLVFVSKLRARRRRPDGAAAGAVRRPLPQDRSWSTDTLTTAEQRLARWRAAAGRFGFDTTEVVAGLRNALANDLNTPKAVRILDKWAENPSLCGPPVAKAVDALLGIKLTV